MALIERCSPNFEGPTPSADALRGGLPVVLRLRHGGEAATTIRYEIAGPSAAPLLLVAGGISAGRHVVASRAFPESGWWQAQRRAFEGCRVLAMDWVGADGAVDRPIDPSDQAEAMVRLLDHLGIETLLASVGASYGAMVGMHLAVSHPRRIGGLLAISGAASAHPYSSACRALQRRTISLGEAAGDAAAGVALARSLAMLTYRTAAEFEGRFTEEPSLVGDRLRVAAEDYLDIQGERHARRMSATAYRRLSESIDLHRIDGARLQLPVTVVGVDHDALVPPADSRALADSISDARFDLIESLYGHDAFLKEERQVAAIITRFLSSLEQHP